MKNLSPYVFLERTEVEGQPCYIYHIVVKDGKRHSTIIGVENKGVRMLGKKKNRASPDTMEIVVYLGKPNTTLHPTGLSETRFVVPKSEVPEACTKTIIVVKRSDRPDGGEAVIVTNNDEDNP